MKIVWHIQSTFYAWCTYSSNTDNTGASRQLTPFTAWKMEKISKTEPNYDIL